MLYPPCSINEHCVRHAFSRVEQQTHGVHLRSLVLTFATRKDNRPIAVQSHLSITQDAPLPSGKLGSTSEGVS